MSVNGDLSDKQQHMSRIEYSAVLAKNEKAVFVLVQADVQGDYLRRKQGCKQGTLALCWSKTGGWMNLYPNCLVCTQTRWRDKQEAGNSDSGDKGSGTKLGTWVKAFCCMLLYELGMYHYLKKTKAYVAG